MFIKNITFLGFNMNIIRKCSPLFIEILKNTACSALGGYILGSHEKKTLRFMAINACAAVLFTGLNAACGKIITGGILACSVCLIVKNSNFEQEDLVTWAVSLFAMRLIFKFVPLTLNKAFPKLGPIIKLAQYIFQKS